MSVDALIWWTIAAAWLAVSIMIVVQIVRLVRALMRGANRVAAFGDLPVIAALERTEKNMARLEAAGARLEPLRERARAAIAVILRGPFPPEIIAAYRRVRAEYTAYRIATGRR